MTSTQANAFINANKIKLISKKMILALAHPIDHSSIQLQKIVLFHLVLMELSGMKNFEAVLYWIKYVRFGRHGVLLRENALICVQSITHTINQPIFVFVDLRNQSLIERQENVLNRLVLKDIFGTKF